MHRILLIIIIISFSLPAVASEVITKENSIILTRDKDANIIKAGKEITMEMPLHIDDFFNDVVIKANGKLKNTTNKYLQIIYVISFYGEDSKLIGAATGNCNLPPDKEKYWGSAMLKGYEENFKKVTSYKLKAYTFEVPPKK
jgi:hypothetical protein